MLREFFYNRSYLTRCVAWFGLLCVVGYSVFLAWIKREINQWYSTFYDLMASAGTATLLENEIGEAGSGLFAPSSPPASTLADYRVRVADELMRFLWIVAPLVLASPAAKWMRSSWAFSWRMSMMRAYLRVWDSRQEPIEGASQRAHEDTQRFASALTGCLATLLDAIFTLIVFTPILLDLSERVAPPVEMGVLRGAWLFLLAAGAAIGGLGGAIIFGKHLVHLEVQNQLVEALLRKDLVLLETTPAVIVGQTVEQQEYAPWRFFEGTLWRLSKNYHALFRHFSLLNTWLSFYDQVMVLMPYFLVAPLLFATNPEQRITLGTLMQTSNSFEKVFASLSVVAESWGAVNEFRAVMVRLHEFEGRLYHTEASPDSPRGGRGSGGGGGGGGGGARGSVRAVANRLCATPRALMSVHTVERARYEDNMPTAALGGDTELVVQVEQKCDDDNVSENSLAEIHPFQSPPNGMRV
tara:strand:- start:5006 stop:6409 length:1404 start_codon:yes stop_codon:yes gene_type:complete